MVDYKWNEEVLVREKDDGSFGKLLNLCKEHMSHKSYKEAYDLAFKAINYNFRAGRHAKSIEILSALDLIDLDVDWNSPQTGEVPITIYKNPDAEYAGEDEEIANMTIHDNVREWLST